MPSSKRKRSGPGLSFADRDASSAPASRPKRTNYNQVYRLPSKLISGPGIFVTCVKGKERKCALQFIDHLNELADDLYPGVKLLPPLKRDDNLPPKKEEAQADEEDLMDAMRNGAAGPAALVAAREAGEEKSADAETATTEEQQGGKAQPTVETETEAHDEPPAPPVKAATVEDDIEAQIKAELAALRGDSEAPNKKTKTQQTKGNKAKAQKDTLEDGTPTQRFKTIETDTECLIFISCARPIDPYKMVYAVLEEVERTGEPRSRFVQRLSPVTDTCSAHPDQVAALAERVIPIFFPAQGPAVTFKIDPRIRSHSILTRDILIQLVAAAIPREGGHRADLKAPDVWIIIEVHKNVCAIGVVHDYERFKKLNVQTIAEATNRKKAEGDSVDSSSKEARGRIAKSLKVSERVGVPPTDVERSEAVKQKDEAIAVQGAQIKAV